MSEASSALGRVPREVLRQVKLIELRTRSLVNTHFGGEYQSVFKGQGMEFADVREYSPGDDVRTIDWNVSARMGHPYVKKYVEERELTVLFVVDLSGSAQFGTRGRFKAEAAAEIAAVLALSAIRNNDRVGLCLFTDRVEAFVPPKKGRRHALRLIRDLLAFEPEGRGTDIGNALERISNSVLGWSGAALEYVGRLLRHRSVVFIRSDFQAREYEHALKTLSRRHDVVAITLTDPRERAVPDVGVLLLEDAETDGRAVLDTASRFAREQFEHLVQEEELRLRRMLRRWRVGHIEVATDRSYVGPLIRFFQARERKRVRG